MNLYHYLMKNVPTINYHRPNTIKIKVLYPSGGYYTLLRTFRYCGKYRYFYMNMLGKTHCISANEYHTRLHCLYTDEVIYYNYIDYLETGGFNDQFLNITVQC